MFAVGNITELDERDRAHGGEGLGLEVVIVVVEGARIDQQAANRTAPISRRLRNR
jgi:hypothetical protein